MKTYASKYKQLDSNWLARQGCFTHAESGSITWGDGEKPSFGLYIDTKPDSGVIEVYYPVLGSKSAAKASIDLTTTPCNYGGERWWFLCPVHSCGKRVGKLYFKDGHFACRHCHNIDYRSKHVSPEERNSPMYKELKILSQIISLEKEIKREAYAGKPTKKKQRVNKLRDKIFEINRGNMPTLASSIR